MAIEPLVVFKRAVGDNRVYGDLSHRGMVWVGRFDNAMGRGKGSSIRALLPEEAVKLTELLLSEPAQGIIPPPGQPYQPLVPSQIANSDGTPVTCPKINRRPRAGDIVKIELSLNLDLAATITDPASPIRAALGARLSRGQLEYFSSEFPWGYTGDEADFVIALRNRQYRYRLLIIEFKRDKIGPDAIVQVLLYVWWVAQICTQFAIPRPAEIEVVPIVIGRRIGDGVARPLDYSYHVDLLGSFRLEVKVRSPRILTYTPVQTFDAGQTSYAQGIRYDDVSHQIPSISWQPPKGIGTTLAEREWVLSLWPA